VLDLSALPGGGGRSYDDGADPVPPRKEWSRLVSCEKPARWTCLKKNGADGRHEQIDARRGSRELKISAGTIVSHTILSFPFLRLGSRGFTGDIRLVRRVWGTLHVGNFQNAHQGRYEADEEGHADGQLLPDG
jgi:hypothetical protein